MDISRDNFTETLIFFFVLKTPELTAKYKPIYFSSDTLKKLFEAIQPHVLQYKEEPTVEQVIMILERENMLKDNITKDLIYEIWKVRAQVNQYSEDWLRDCAKSYAEWNNFIYSINKMHAFLMTTQNEVTVETCHEYVQKVKNIFTSDSNFDYIDSVGHDFFDPAEHKSIRLETVSSGWPFLDKCLGGGFAKGTLTVIAGGPKIGKSQFLCNLAAQSVMQGHNSLYITLEMGPEIVNQRIGSNLFNIPYKDYDQYAEDPEVLRKYMKNMYNQAYTTPGALVVEQFPTSCLTPLELETFILGVEQARSTEDRPFKFRNIFVDYLNIMKSGRPGLNAGDTYMKIKSIAEDVRAVAIRLQKSIISLTQMNRQGSVNVSDIDMSAISESHGLIQTVDCCLGIIQTNIMKAEGFYYLKALATRNSDQMGNKKRYIFQGDYMRIREDETEDIIPETIPIPENLCIGANDYQKIMYGAPSYHKKPSGDNQQSEHGQAAETKNTSRPSGPVQQAAPSTKGLDLGATELKISGYDLFQ